MTDNRVWDEDIERCAMRLYALSVTRVKNGLPPLATGPTPLSTIISWEELPQRDKDAWRTTAEKVIGPECRPLEHDKRSDLELKGRERERLDVLAFLRNPPGRLTDAQRRFVDELIDALKGGRHERSERR